MNHLDEVVDGQQSDILDHAYCIIQFDGGAKCSLELCMFAEASKNQEEISIVGTQGKVEAFAPAHGTQAAHSAEPNVRVGLRDMEAAKASSVKPPSPVAVEELTVLADTRLLEAGYHEGATYFELERFLLAVTGEGPVEASVLDGLLSVAMAEGCQRSISSGQPVALNSVIAPSTMEMLRIRARAHSS